MKCVRCHAEIEKSYMACPRCGEPVTDFTRRYSDQPIDGKYEIVERLGAGGMGEVFKVRHTYLGASRVVKVIRPQIAGSQDANDRFLREAQLATKVHHQNVATLHDFSALPDGSHYMVWEYIEGENLAQRLRTAGTLPPRVAVRIAIQALEGLEAIHRAGIVHRDISPENLMLTNDGVKIIDLGVAKAEEIDSGTKTGMFVGKIRYASPEQLGFLAENEKIDGRADLYSLGVVLYEMLTGRPPFDAKSPHEYVLMHSREMLPPPLQITQNLPGGAALQAILEKALQHDRTNRFASAADFAAALAAVEKTLPDPRTTQTIATPFEGERTMRVSDTLHAPTIHTEAPTLRTPLPTQNTIPGQPAAQTIRTAVPQGPGEPQPRRSIAPLLIAIVVMFIAALIAVVYLMRTRQPAGSTAVATTTAARSTVATAPPAQSSVDVVPPATTSSAPATIVETTTTATPATTTTAAPAPKKTVEKTAPVMPVPAKETQPAAVETTAAAPTYFDGRGDHSGNEAAMRQAQEQLAGVKRIAVRGSDAQLIKELTSAVKEKVTVADDADVVIEFNGRVDRMGFGRKKRSATATISKRGHAIFRYELPAEEYRVGDDPAEAFARVLGDLIGR